MNLIEYVKEMGTFSMDEIPFNEVDAAILSYITYCKWENLEMDIETQWIEFSSLRFHEQEIIPMDKSPEQFGDLITLMIFSVRFSSMKIGFFQSVMDLDVDEQFAAITFIGSDHIHNICFRGTDTSIVGWKEDFNMLFNKHVSGQISASNYFLSHSFDSFRLIGHSKGGNLAAYCAWKQDCTKCVGIYNFDGPGFLNENIHVHGPYYKFIPSCSIIGLIMENRSDFTIVESNAKHLHQHDLFSWVIENNQFVRVNELEPLAQYFQISGNAWLRQASLEKRKVFVETFYELIQKENLESIYDFQISHASHIIKGFHQLDKETQNIVNEIIKSIIQTNLKETKKFIRNQLKK